MQHMFYFIKEKIKINKLNFKKNNIISSAAYVLFYRRKENNL